MVLPIGDTEEVEAAAKSRFSRSTDERKTVTFGDGSSVTGDIRWSVISVVVVLIAWFLLTNVWGISSEFEAAAEANAVANDVNFNQRELLRQCDQAPDCSYVQFLNDRVLPSPIQVVTAFGEVISDGFRNVSFWEHIGISFLRVVLGLGLGILIGVPIGLAMGLNNLSRGVFDPIVEFFRPIPPLAFIALVIVWFGIGELSKVVILFFAALWIMIIAARAGVLGVKVSKVHAAYSLGASKLQILKNVIIPNALPEIFTGTRVALGVCWGTLVAAEIVGSNKGLGAMTWLASKFLRMDVVVVGIIIIGAIGFFLDVMMRKLEARLIPWRGKG